MKSLSGLSMRLWRQLLPGPPVNSIHGQLFPGDWLESFVYVHLDRTTQHRLGKPISDQKLESIVGEIGDRIVIRPTTGSEVLEAQDGQGFPFDIIICKSVEYARERLRKTALAPEYGALLVDEGVSDPSEFGLFDIGTQLARVIGPAPFACAPLNASEPVSLPIANEAGPTPRLPGGKSLWEASEALKDDLAYEEGYPAQPGVVLVSPGKVRQLAEGPLSLAGSITVPSAYCYRETDKSPVVARLFRPTKGSWTRWPDVVAKMHGHISGASNPNPVVFYSSAVGSWGGVAVLLRLADELQAQGIRSFVVYHHKATEWSWPTKTAPLRVRTAGALAANWQSLTRSKGGILVTSNWGAGGAALEIGRANPEVRLTTFLQDREDRFEDRNGKPVGMKDFLEYFQIHRGVSVSKWVLDSLQADGIFDSASRYQVIGAGIDTTIFKPVSRPENPKPRVLGMWRPQTDIRRGGALLRKVYGQLHAEFGSNISLELFGWDSPLPSGKAPPFARHHGALNPRQVADLMAQVDVVIEPSVYQGFGLPGLEGMACGAALASTACLGVDEYATHEQNALVVPHEELGAAVRRLIVELDLRNRLREAGPSAAARFSWPNIAEKWIEYLDGIL